MRQCKRSFLFGLAGLIFTSCAHEVTTTPENYNILDGHKSGEIRSTGIGMDGSPAANQALRNGQDEVLNKVCAGRKVTFTAIGEEKITVLNTTTTKIGNSSITSGGASEHTIIRGWRFNCFDADVYKDGLFYLNQKKLVCLELEDGAVGVKRLEGLLKNPETGYCTSTPGWFRTKTFDDEIVYLFYGSTGKNLCNKVLEEIINSEKDPRLFLRKKLKPCPQKTS